MRIVALSALTLLSGCSFFVPRWEGVWLVLEPVVNDGTPQSDFCDNDCDENFSDADCPDAPDIDEVWDYTIDEKLSPAAYFIQVFNGRGGEVFAVINDEVYRGDATVKTLTLTWEGETDSLDEAEHIDDGYTFSTTELSSSVETYTLTKAPAKEEDDADGTFARKIDSMIEYSESDEWDPRDVIEVPSGQIPSGSLSPDNQGDNVNTADGDECSGGNCELMLSTSCKFPNEKFTAVFAGKYENGMYDGISKGTQPAGD